MTIALTREVSPNLGRCELTHLDRVDIDVDLAIEQHRHYQEALAALGCRVITLPAEPELPDSVFVEDVAVVLDELAVLCRPGAESRRPEVAGAAAALRPYRELVSIEVPGTLDGGDVLRVGRKLFVGLSGRTNHAGIKELRRLVADWGYGVTGVDVTGCLHLKSAVTQVAPGTLLINPRWVDQEVFEGLELIEIDPTEPYAANALQVGEGLIYPACFPRTAERLALRGHVVTTVDVSELQKAEGATTCCSLILAGDQDSLAG